ncbi:MAG: hypothetical protein JWL97_323 [Gemmatimonadales bacterium]|nr:hypothetical protein [Gemmatimonadales bacterium]
MRDRKGFALAAALLAVVLIGVLVGGVLFAATEATKVGAIGLDRQIALDACEAAIATTITDPGLLLPDSIGVEGTISNHRGLGPEIIVYITRVDSALYSVLAESVPELGSAGGAHRIGVVVRSSVAPDGSITIDPISERPWFEVF